MDADPGDTMVIQTLFIWLEVAFGAIKHRRPQHTTASAESGQGLVEYAMILILVGVVVMALLLILGPTLSNLFTNIIENVEGAQ